MFVDIDYCQQAVMNSILCSFHRLHSVIKRLLDNHGHLINWSHHVKTMLVAMVLSGQQELVTLDMSR
jgi:hypothetical protein